MRPLTILILTLLIAACSSKQADKSLSDKTDLEKVQLVTDSCLQGLYIDEQSVETSLKTFWESAQEAGYTFDDDLSVPYEKIIFHPASSRFYNDTLKISDCHIFDSVNIHMMVIRSRKPVSQNTFSDLRVEEWQFKNSLAATDYANAQTDYYKKGYGLKSPTAVLLTNKTVYIFQTSAYTFISEMEKAEKLLKPNAKVCVINY